MSKKIQFKLDFEQDLDQYLSKEFPLLSDYRVIGKALDARNSNRGKRPHYNYNIEVIYKGEKFSIYKEEFKDLGKLEQKTIIIGAGPCGLFSALRLMEYGIPSIIIERGDTANNRMKAIAKFWRYGIFDDENNVCYGEGGAGLFSDGKLITRIKSPYVQYVMNKLVEFGAPPETAFTSNPHLGSNKIRSLIYKISEYLKSNGCEFLYNTRVEKLIFEKNLIDDMQDKKIVGVELANNQKLFSSDVILATGHSAKEMYLHLKEKKVELKAKSFAVGVRIEHPRRLMNKIQHGDFCERPSLESARYKLSYHNKKSNKGTYSFCMCPGGYVLSSGTDRDGLVVNGMSNFKRNSPWSNSALVVSVEAGIDFDIDDVLGGMKFQRKIETDAYKLSLEHATGREIPAQNLKDFLSDKYSKTVNKTSCPSKVFSSKLDKLMPGFITDHLKEGLLNFDRKMPGFISNDSLLLAPETRTSAPVTILRDRVTLESTSVSGLFPGGEGAGYAGGITSAAVDGVNIAMAIILKHKGFSVKELS